MGKGRCSTVVHAALAGALLMASATSLAQAVPAQGREVASVHFYIEEKALIAALSDWSRQSGLQIVWPSRSQAQYGKTTLLQGTFAPMQALELLLRNSGLTYSMINDRTVVIKEPPPATTTSAAVTQKFWRAAADTRKGAWVPQSSTRRQSQAGDTFEDSIAEVVVTGTHIRGAAPIGSPVTTYDREQFDRAGAGTVEQFARRMPGNFSNVDPIAGAGSNASLVTTGSGAPNSFNNSAFNLSGLGPGATLTLLDGHRVAPAGNDGAFVDISMIPLTAVDHIEVLSDGASAIYGADAVAGVVNIVTRDDFDGAESQVRYGGATDGGADAFRASQLLGTSWNSGNLLLNYEYNRKDRLDASQRDYIGDQGGPASLAAADRVHGVFLSGRQDIDAASTISVNALASKRDTTAPYTNVSSIARQLLFMDTESKQYGAVVAADRSFAHGWRVALTANYSNLEQENLSTLAIDFIDFGYDQRSSMAIHSRERSLDAIVDGMLFYLPAGPVKLAAGASYRKENFRQVSALTQSTGLEILAPMATLGRDARSVFGEVSIPIVGARNNVPLARLVEVSLAARHDEYSDFGATSNPKIGLKWALSSALDVRGTYGESFRAPLLAQLAIPANYQTYFIPNPDSPDGFTNTLFIGGGNSALDPETAEMFTLGLDFHPESLPALKLSATYFDTRFFDRVAPPPVTFDAQIFTNPLAAPFLDLSPSAAQIEAAFNSPDFLGDNAGMGPSGVTAIFDNRLTNLSTVKQSGVQLHAEYGLSTRLGELTFTTHVDRLLEYELQVAPGANYNRMLNTFGEPTKWRGQAHVAWSRAGFTTAMAIHHVGSYDNSLAVPREPIDAWTTGDLYFSYDASDTSNAWMRGLRVSLSVQNVTNEEPPYVRIPPELLLPGVNPLPFDPTHASPLGRFIAVQLSKRWDAL